MGDLQNKLLKPVTKNYLNKIVKKYQNNKSLSNSIFLKDILYRYFSNIKNREILESKDIESKILKNLNKPDFNKQLYYELLSNIFTKMNNMSSKYHITIFDYCEIFFILPKLIFKNILKDEKNILKEIYKTELKSSRKTKEEYIEKLNKIDTDYSKFKINILLGL